LIKTLCPAAIKNNRVDRNILAEFLIRNPGEIKTLEALIHPLVHEQYQSFIAQAKNRAENLVVIDIPLLFETEYDYELNAVALTFCDAEEQKRRAMSRKGMTEKKFNTILLHQMDQAEKKQRADYLIDTNGTLEQTQDQVTQIIGFCLNA
jgi:dephospho-CoA kinase